MFHHQSYGSTEKPPALESFHASTSPRGTLPGRIVRSELVSWTSWRAGPWGAPWCGDGSGISARQNDPLVNKHSELEHGHRFTVDLPIESDDFPQLCLSLSEGTSCKTRWLEVAWLMILGDPKDGFKGSIQEFFMKIQHPETIGLWLTIMYSFKSTWTIIIWFGVIHHPSLSHRNLM